MFTLILPNSIGNLKKLQVLNLENCHLKSLPDSICHLTALKELKINSNFLYDLSERITKFLLDLKVIPEKDLAFLKLNKEHSKVLFELENLIGQKFTHVNFMNKRERRGIGPLSNEYKIENNEITALYIKFGWELREIKKIPPIIGKIKSLKYLECRGYFTEIPKFLSNLTSLESLKLIGFIKKINNLKALVNF